MIDTNAYIGGYPFRHIPHPDPAILARVLEREGLDGAWVGHLPSAFYRDPAPGNAKQLKVQYTIDGKTGEATFAENALIMLPTPK